MRGGSKHRPSRAKRDRKRLESFKATKREVEVKDEEARLGALLLGLALMPMKGRMGER